MVHTLKELRTITFLWVLIHGELQPNQVFQNGLSCVYRHEGRTFRRADHHLAHQVTAKLMKAY